MKSMALVFFVAVVALGVTACSSERLVIHEWGTFTSLQNDLGAALGGLNADGEGLPKFVKSIDLGFEADDFKGLSMVHPEVSMRLETPVVYFHPPQGLQKPIELDFTAQFNSGWLTQYYPDAEVSAPGLRGKAKRSSGHLKESTAGTLTWKGLKIGGTGTLVAAKENVWTAPRDVDAALVTTAKGQSERFLFYRGIGHLDAPLTVTRTEGQLCIRANVPVALKSSSLDVRTLWLAHFRPDGQCAFRELKPKGASLVSGWGDENGCLTTPAEFSLGDYGPENLKALRGSLRRGLVADGLYADEADALLNTWNQAYFKTAGLRLFFLVPRAWTDAVLPIKVSVDADISRTMVGRIELIGPEQRAALKNLAAMKPADENDVVWKQVSELGRFRTSLLWELGRMSPGAKWVADRFAAPAYKLE